MKHKLSTTLALVVLTMAIAAATARAQTVANGPYYAPPAWDQTLPVATRFIVLSNMNNEAVLDRETGLVWQRTVGTSSQTFSLARQACAAVETGNRKGWRLPSLHELLSLVDPSVTVPFPALVVALPAGHPFINGNGPTQSFWTGTTISEIPSGAFFMPLLAGAGAGADLKSSSHAFWCVRGGGPINVY